MSTSTISPGISIDEFQALEQKVLRAIEIVKREREARATAEAEVVELRTQLEEHLTKQADELTQAQNQLSTLNHEREAVRQRVEKMMQQMDELL
jgi:chromosome segregation ATPase